MKRKHRGYMPQYAERDAFVVSGQQLQIILRGINPFRDDPPNWNQVGHRKSYRIAFLKDGTCWVENYRSGAPMFAPDFWWQISNAASKRAVKLYEFTLSLKEGR